MLHIFHKACVGVVVCSESPVGSLVIHSMFRTLVVLDFQKRGCIFGWQQLSSFQLWLLESFVKIISSVNSKLWVAWVAYKFLLVVRNYLVLLVVANTREVIGFFVKLQDQCLWLYCGLSKHPELCTYAIVLSGWCLITVGLAALLRWHMPPL